MPFRATNTEKINEIFSLHSWSSQSLSYSGDDENIFSRIFLNLNWIETAIRPLSTAAILELRQNNRNWTGYVKSVCNKQTKDERRRVTPPKGIEFAEFHECFQPSVELELSLSGNSNTCWTIFGWWEGMGLLRWDKAFDGEPNWPFWCSLDTIKTDIFINNNLDCGKNVTHVNSYTFCQRKRPAFGSTIR